MALPVFMQDVDNQVRIETNTTLDDNSRRLIRIFNLLAAPRPHNDISIAIDLLNGRIADTRFGIDYATVDRHVESSMRSMISGLYQNGTENFFNDSRSRLENIGEFINQNIPELEKKIRTDRILNLNRPAILATIQDHINEYHTTATHDEREKIALQLKRLSDRAHSKWNLRPELVALADDPYTILANHAI